MDQDPFSETMVCWLCDYGITALAIVVVILIGLWRWRALFPPNEMGNAGSFPRPGPVQTLALQTAVINTATWTPVEASLTPEATETEPSAAPRSTPTAETGLIASTSTPAASFGMPTLTLAPSTPAPTPTPAKPDYILVFVPLKWQGAPEEFYSAAQAHARAFTSASGMEAFFQVAVVVIESGPAEVDLSSDTLVDDLVNFGLAENPGDRYIGLTDSDISSDGDADVAGWTLGPDSLGIVAESFDPYITAHELGHTYGLCDEYSYPDWVLQNEEFPDGCPNPYPPGCPQDSHEICPGQPSEAGLNSIMGPAGLVGEYGYNEVSWEFLQMEFAQMTRGGVP